MRREKKLLRNTRYEEIGFCRAGKYAAPTLSPGSNSHKRVDIRVELCLLSPAYNHIGSFFLLLLSLFLK